MGAKNGGEEFRQKALIALSDCSIAKNRSPNSGFLHLWIFRAIVKKYKVGL
jgi:hypothetical protein